MIHLKEGNTMEENRHVYLSNQVISEMMARITFLNSKDLDPLPLVTEEEFIRDYIAQVGPYSVLCHINKDYQFEVIVMDWLEFVSKDDSVSSNFFICDDEDFEDRDTYFSGEYDEDEDDFEILDEDEKLEKQVQREVSKSVGVNPNVK